MASTTRKNILKTFKVAIGPGRFILEDFTKRGYIQPLKLALYHQYARLAGLRASLGPLYDPFFKKDTIFVRHQNGVLNENMTHDFISQPIHGLFTVTYVGSSSLMCNTQIILEKQQKCISTSIAQCICVNLKTRRPAHYPESVKEVYSYAAMGAKPKITTLLSTPESTEQMIYNKKVIIRDEDVDVNGHTNNAAYIKLCSDVAYNAITDKVLSHVTNRCMLSKYTIHYLGETVKGDEVKFKLWEDSQNKYLIHFEAKKGDEIIVRCAFNFNQKLSSSL